MSGTNLWDFVLIDLIRNLECKLKSLRNEEGKDNHVSLASSQEQEESSNACQKTELADSGRGLSVEEQPANTLTQETQTNCLPQHQPKPSARSKLRKRKASSSSGQGNNTTTENPFDRLGIDEWTGKGRRTQRKRTEKTNWNLAWWSKEESGLWNSANITDVLPKASSTTNTQIPRSSEVNFRRKAVRNGASMLKGGIVDSVVEKKDSPAFHGRLQKQVLA